MRQKREITLSVRLPVLRVTLLVAWHLRSLSERHDVLAACLVLAHGAWRILGCSQLRQRGTCVTSAGECLQVTVTMSKQGTLGLSIWENQVRGGRGGHAESAPGGAGGVGGPNSRRRDSGGSCPSVWDADQDTTDQRLGHSSPLLLTTLKLEGQDQGAGQFHVWGQPSSWFVEGRLLAVSSWRGRGKELQGPVSKGTDPIMGAPCS